jgi:medium-chain acyl-[acyl-carrier-protein] hydrolase
MGVPLPSEIMPSEIMPSETASHRAANEAAMDVWFEKLVSVSDSIPGTSSINSGMTMLCFPYSGSGVAMFATWKKHLTRGVNLRAARLPGREARLKEAPREDLIRMTEEIADAIAASEIASRPLCLTGFSLGGWIAFEVARGLRRRGIDIDLLVAGASRAPHGRWIRGRMSGLSDDRFLKKLNRRYQAVPKMVMNNAEARALLVPMLRGDNKMYETYEYVPEEPLECEILTMGGTKDPGVKRKHIYPWHQLTKRFRYRTIEGGNHYLAKENVPAVVNIVNQRLRRVMS